MINRMGSTKETDIYAKQIMPSKVLNLTANQKIVYETLLNLRRSAGAYELLNLLKKKINAAATVYSALNKLTQKGLVQRIISTRTFIAHQKPKSKGDDSVLLICAHCGQVSVLNDKQIVEVFNKNIEQCGYRVSTYHLELMVTCDTCTEKGN